MESGLPGASVAIPSQFAMNKAVQISTSSSSYRSDCCCWSNNEEQLSSHVTQMFGQPQEWQGMVMLPLTLFQLLLTLKPYFLPVKVVCVKFDQGYVASTRPLQAMVEKCIHFILLSNGTASHSQVKNGKSFGFMGPKAPESHKSQTWEPNLFQPVAHYCDKNEDLAVENVKIIPFLSLEQECENKVWVILPCTAPITLSLKIILSLLPFLHFFSRDMLSTSTWEKLNR